VAAPGPQNSLPGIPSHHRRDDLGHAWLHAKETRRSTGKETKNQSREITGKEDEISPADSEFADVAAAPVDGLRASPARYWNSMAVL
jgi:hypothetical protein